MSKADAEDLLSLAPLIHRRLDAGVTPPRVSWTNALQLFAADCQWGIFLPFDTGIVPSYTGIVNTTVTIDKAGRVVIPKEIRDELRLEAGDTLALESQGERVTLRPVHAGTPLQKERGVWVFRGGKPLSLDEANQLVRDAREQRDRQNTGEHGR